MTPEIKPTGSRIGYCVRLLRLNSARKFLSLREKTWWGDQMAQEISAPDVACEPLIWIPGPLDFPPPESEYWKEVAEADPIDPKFYERRQQTASNKRGF